MAWADAKWPRSKYKSRCPSAQARIGSFRFFVKNTKHPAVRKVLERLSAALREFKIDRRSQVVVGYSGGVDSTALLWALRRLHPHRRPHVEAVCVDHGLRPESSEHAEGAVEIARSLGVEARVVKVVCEGKGGIEAAARRARYAALARIAEGRPILTAHTADDQAETVLYRMAKGAGLRGIGAIRPRLCLEGALLLRPLLDVRRQELEEVVRHASLPVVVDPTNAAAIFARNRIRHELLPALEAAVPGAIDGLARAAALGREDESFLTHLAQRERARMQRDEGLCAPSLARLPRALSSRILRDLLGEVGATPSARQIEGLLGILDGGEFRISEEWVVRSREGILSLKRQKRGDRRKTNRSPEHPMKGR